MNCCSRPNQTWYAEVLGLETISWSSELMVPKIHERTRHSMRIQEGTSDVGEHVICQCIFAKSGQEVLALLGEVRRGEVEDDEDERPDVEDIVGLRMERGNGDSLGEGHPTGSFLVAKRGISASGSRGISVATRDSNEASSECVIRG
uniref:Uncharacterized protein n=1 Tax=Arundo donax TaxID=35708 RepID=A0A0A9FH21_ARUDO